MTQQPAEMALIEGLRLEHPKMSVSKAAKLAEMSEGRWRQLAKGYQQVTPDTRVPTTAPAETLARMAKAVGATAEQLEAANRLDAAQVMRSVKPAASSTAMENAPEKSVRGPLAYARHNLEHMWGSGEKLVDEVLDLDPPTEVKRLLRAVVAFALSSFIADQFIEFSITREERDELLAELYRRRDRVIHKIGAIDALEAASEQNAPTQDGQAQEVSDGAKGGATGFLRTEPLTPAQDKGKRRTK